MRTRPLGIAAVTVACLLAFAASGSAAAPSLIATRAPSPAPGAKSDSRESKAATPTKSASTTSSQQSGYVLEFTLPTFGKAGCLVCHGDPRLVMSKSGINHSFWIDQKAYKASAHGDVMCTGCHIDYGYKAPHGQRNANWRATAKQACKNCHGPEFRDYSLGSHMVRALPGGKPDPKAAQKPLCGDCHGGHYMPVLKKNPAGRAELHATAERMCGSAGCHKDYWDNYDDYWHGAAYKAGAPDAPACWQCHGAHTVFPTKNKISPTNSLQLASTCGACHEGASESYMQFVPLIHYRGDALKSNPVYSVVSGLLGKGPGSSGGK